MLLQQVSTQQSRIADDMSVIRDAGAAVLARLAAIDTRNELEDRDRLDHEVRIRGLERWRWTLAGVVIVLGVAAGFLGDYLGVITHR